MNTKELPYGIKPHEIAFLILLCASLFYFNGEPLAASWKATLLFGTAVLGAVGVLIGRCPEEWRMLPNKSFFFGLTAVWILLFSFLGNSVFGILDSSSIFSWMFYEYNIPSTDSAYCLFIPFVIIALFWWKRKELVTQPLTFWSGGIWLFALAVLLHLVAYLIQQPRVSATAFFIGLYALMGLAWGKNWLKACFFPFFLVIFSVPIGATATLAFTFKLRLFVCWLVEHIAHLGLAPDLIRDGTILTDAQHTFAYDVVAACSGIRSLTMLVAFTTIYGFMTLKVSWKRAVLISASIPIAVLGNVARLCFTIAVAELLGQDAGKAVETDAGFVTFGVAIVSVYFLSLWLEKFNAPKNNPPQPPTATAATA